MNSRGRKKVQRKKRVPCPYIIYIRVSIRVSVAASAAIIPGENALVAYIYGNCPGCKHKGVGA